jgi:hypothetical protein
MKAGGVDDADEIGMDLSAYDEAMRFEKNHKKKKKKKKKHRVSH